MEESDQAPAPPHNPGLLKLIESKRKWGYRPDSGAARRGFQGWHERGYLPHFDAPHVTQFVSFMLADAFPVTRRREWEPILREPNQSYRRRKLEAWLDRGCGERWLARPDVATRIEEILRAEDGQSCRLQAWVIMPNHVHLVVDVWQTPLSKTSEPLEGAQFIRCQPATETEWTLLGKEAFDSRIRDAQHLSRAIRYTENNPSKAGLVRDPKEWLWSSARWRDAHGRLHLHKHAALEA